MKKGGEMFGKQDPVCKARVRMKAAYTFHWKGKTYYFDSPACRDTFKNGPEAFVRKKSGRGFLGWVAKGSKGVPKSCHDVKR